MRDSLCQGLTIHRKHSLWRQNSAMECCVDQFMSMLQAEAMHRMTRKGALKYIEV